VTITAVISYVDTMIQFTYNTTTNSKPRSGYNYTDLYA